MAILGGCIAGWMADPTAVQAASVLFDSQTFSDATVSTNGTLVGAINFNGTNATTVTVNTVTFTAQNATGSNAIALSGNVIANAFDGSAANTPGGGVAGSLFENGIYTNNNANRGNLTFTGLTIGQNYLLQLFIGDARAPYGNRTVNIWDQGGRSGTPELANLDYTSASGGGANLTITGTFLADATSQALFIAIDDDGNYTNGYGGVNNYPGHLNAFQLRAVIPEPGTLTALLLGAGLFLQRRRRR